MELFPHSVIQTRLSEMVWSFESLNPSCELRVCSLDRGGIEPGHGADSKILI